jgi:hypothetical protein
VQIPIVPLIDERLYEKRIPGFRFASMPPDGEAYQLGLRAINSMAKKVIRPRVSGDPLERTRGNLEINS